MDKAESTFEGTAPLVGAGAGAEQPRRSCLGCLFTSSLGCGAFFFGTVLAAALFAPRMLSVPASTLVQKVVNDSIEGELSIEELELSWSGQQKVTGVTLLDPGGIEILEFSGWMPSLGTLLGGDATRWPARVHVRFAKVVIGADGVSNLARALGKPGEPWSPSAEELEMRHERTYELRADLSEIDVIDERSGTQFLLTDGVLVLSYVHGTRMKIDFQGEFHHGTETGQLEIDGAYERDANGDLARVDWTIDTEDLPTPIAGAVLSLLFADEPLAALELREFLGESLTGGVSLHGDPSQEASFEARIGERALEEGGGRLGIDVVGSVSAGRASLTPGNRNTVTFHVPERICEERIRKVLPAGSVFARRGEGPWTLDVSSLVLDLGQHGQSGAAPEPARRGSSFVANLRPSCWFELADEARPEETFVLDQASITFDSATDGELAIAVSVQVGAGGGVRAVRPAHIDLRTEESLYAVLSSLLGDDSSPPFSIDCEVADLSTDSLGPFGTSVGWLADFLGESLELHVRVPDTSAVPLTADVELAGGAQRRIHEAHLVDDVLHSVAGSGIDLELPLDDRLRDRVLTPLLPWLADLESDNTVRLIVESFELPLDEDLSRLRARIRIDLRAVNYRLHTGLRQHFTDTPEADGADESTAAGADRRLPERILPIVLMIEDGIVTYEQFTLPLGGEECDLDGTLDLATGQVSVRTDVPMRAVGRQLGIKPSMADLLSANDIPTGVTLQGAWADPRLMVELGDVREIMQSIEDFALPAFRAVFGEDE